MGPEMRFEVAVDVLRESVYIHCIMALRLNIYPPVLALRSESERASEPSPCGISRA